MAKNDNKNAKRLAIDAAHAKLDKQQIGIVQQGRNTACALGLGSAFNQIIKSITKNTLPNNTRCSNMTAT